MPKFKPGDTVFYMGEYGISKGIVKDVFYDNKRLMFAYHMKAHRNDIVFYEDQLYSDPNAKGLQRK